MPVNVICGADVLHLQNQENKVFLTGIEAGKYQVGTEASVYWL